MKSDTLVHEMGCPECDWRELIIIAWTMPLNPNNPNLVECERCGFQGRADEFMLAPKEPGT